MQSLQNFVKYAAHVPWFIYDLSNRQLITQQPVPTEIDDDKGIVLTEVPVPGLNYRPIVPAGGENRVVSFTLPVINRDNNYGNMLLLQQFEMLRNQAGGISAQVSPRRFRPTPKVLYYWGIGSVPLPYYVRKCGMRHHSQMTNGLGLPQYTEVDIELVLDEQDPLYQAEQAFRMVGTISGMGTSAFDLVRGALSGGAPF